MYKLYKSGNYIIFEDNGVAKGEYPLNQSVYSVIPDGYVIKEAIDQGRLTINSLDIINGLWVDENNVAFTDATLVEFLRTNTGFNPASGGSEVVEPLIYRAFMNQSTTSNPTVPNANIIKNTMLQDPTFLRVGVGQYQLKFYSRIPLGAPLEDFWFECGSLTKGWVVVGGIGVGLDPIQEVNVYEVLILTYDNSTGALYDSWSGLQINAEIK